MCLHVARSLLYRTMSAYVHFGDLNVSLYWFLFTIVLKCSSTVETSQHPHGAAHTKDGCPPNAIVKPAEAWTGGTFPFTSAPAPRTDLLHHPDLWSTIMNEDIFQDLAYSDLHHTNSDHVYM